MDGRRQLDPGVSATPNHKRQAFLAFSRIVGLVGGFDGVDQVVAQLDRVRGRGELERPPP